MRGMIGMLALVGAAVAGWAGFAAAQGRDPAGWLSMTGEQYRSDQAQCRQARGRLTLVRGTPYVRAVDFNDDGEADNLIDYHGVQCSGAPAMFCRRGECLFTLMASVRNGIPTRFADFHAVSAEVVTRGRRNFLMATSADGHRQLWGWIDDGFEPLSDTQLARIEGRGPPLPPGALDRAWRVRTHPQGYVMAATGGSVALGEMFLYCRDGQPEVAVRAGSTGNGSRQETLLIATTSGRAGLPMTYDAGDELWHARPADARAIALLAGAAPRADVTFLRLYGPMELSGSTGAIQEALAGCWGGGAATAAAGPNGSDEAQVRALVSGIYDNYARPPGENGARGDDFSPALAALVARTTDPDEGLGADPYCDCQDYDQARYAIRAVSVRGAIGEARVEFSNFGESHMFTLNLVKTPRGWRVDDIVGANGSFRASLRPAPRRRR